MGRRAGVSPGPLAFRRGPRRPAHAAPCRRRPVHRGRPDCAGVSYTTTYCITGSSRSILLEIQRDDALMVRIHQGWEAFQVHLDQDAPPALRTCSKSPSHEMLGG
ncbi:hypothetical protein F5985_11640 [Malikia spinosa]|uniref:Uncharacterized protein n=1 Tax=Malikia spinosa TaxID=86180 RepID=A0A7C9IYB6_9BURK|nr:hypothetical protein [Malikia spinosa]